MLEPIKKTRLYEEIVKQLVEQINNGTLKPGDRLPTERETAIQLNVSRTAIREALRSLELMGFIESKVGGGTYIRKITIDNVINPFSNLLTKDRKLIAELIEVRQLLEVEVARLAARKVTDRKAAAIEKTLDLMDREIQSGKVGLNGDNAFHNELAIAAENLALEKILGMCSELLSSTREVALNSMKDVREGLKQHRDIYMAVKAGQEDEAADRMKKHLVEAYKNVMSKEK